MFLVDSRCGQVVLCRYNYLAVGDCGILKGEEVSSRVGLLGEKTSILSCLNFLEFGDCVVWRWRFFGVFLLRRGDRLLEGECPTELRMSRLSGFVPVGFGSGSGWSVSCPVPPSCTSPGKTGEPGVGGFVGGFGLGGTDSSSSLLPTKWQPEIDTPGLIWYSLNISQCKLAY